MASLIGHDAAWSAWNHAIQGDRMHHAWLLTGKAGLGKATFAQSAARKMLGTPDVTDHPDIITITNGPKNNDEAKKRDSGKPYERARGIKVDQIREAQKRLVTRPTLGDKRVVIIDPADDMEKGASNALLKSLEEPPVGTYFLLVAHSPARLLSTIRSRCRVVRFQPLNDEQILKVLRSAEPDADAATLDAAVSAARGSPGAAVKFLRLDLGRSAQLMGSILEEGDQSHQLRAQLAAAIGAKQDIPRVQAILSLARSILADRIASEPYASPAFVDIHAKLVRLSSEQPTFNYDPGMLALQIGTLLAQARTASERVDV